MSKILAKIEYIQKNIKNIEIIINRHQSLENALRDEIEAKAAILMAMLQIGETLNKIDNNLLKEFNLEIDARGAYSVRNFIAHDYEGVDIDLISEIIKDNLPKLNEKLDKLKNKIKGKR